MFVKLLRTGVKKASAKRPTYAHLTMPPEDIQFKTRSEIKLDQVIRPVKPKRIPPQQQELWNKLTTPQPPLNYPLRPESDIQNPLIPLGDVDHLPFFIQRTKSGNLPVYKEYRQGRAISYTTVRLIYGDFEKLMEELQKITGGSEVEAKVGEIRIHGSHKAVVENYLARLGF